MSEETTYTAFQGTRQLASGPPLDVARAIRAVTADPNGATVLVFDDATGRSIDLDLRGSDAEIAARLAPVTAEAEPARGPGRPRLGVVAREVTLLPRHWDWLGQQPGGASVALRRLVDAARTANASADRIRQARQAADRFMVAMAGNAPGYEEASRALYAGQRVRFEAQIATWPVDIRHHVLRLATLGFDDPSTESFS